ncbi:MULTISPECIES: GNAT family N-acetyltransferase [Actinoplanes]|uniref:GNAT family N-acetyltransferase n=1 Tax=Actinoplanes TaxID=1865 RepID=UPI0005F27AFD|nr:MULTISPECIES: GNAT family N-acetyltransferase [Actinoplanes]GLY07817.1 N-acetyltransferase [Actinoplanes sp. NBRC 101535]
MNRYRHATADDLPAVAALLAEVERFYGADELPPRDEWERQIASLLFSDGPAARVLLAADGDGVVRGFASYSFLWPAAGITKSLFLKELYVREPFRRHGVGTALMARLGAIAVGTGCSRMEWSTDADNVEARRFYRRLGDLHMPSKLMYRAEGDDLLRLAQPPQARPAG